jgi:hypothetical protein
MFPLAATVNAPSNAGIRKPRKTHSQRERQGNAEARKPKNRTKGETAFQLLEKP